MESLQTTEDLPFYLRQARPVPSDRRLPWFQTTGPAYASTLIQVHIMAGVLVSMQYGHLGYVVLGSVLGMAAASLALFVIPALLGMRTGFNLYVLGAAIFGARGGIIIPGLTMGLLQVGWLALKTYLATYFLALALGLDGRPFTLWFMLLALAWTVLVSAIALYGVRLIGRVGTYLPLLLFAVVVVMAVRSGGGTVHFTGWKGASALWTFGFAFDLVFGMMATGSCAAPDYTRHNRSRADVLWSAFLGVAVTFCVFYGLSILVVAGVNGSNPGLHSVDLGQAILGGAGSAATLALLVFAIASIPSGTFSVFIYMDSFTTMLPRLSRRRAAFILGAAAWALAATGASAQISSFFGLVGASFGPVAGMFLADFLLAGGHWGGPRRGVNWAGIAAWVPGFLIGVLPNPLIARHTHLAYHPAGFYAFLATGLLYYACGRLGLLSGPLAASADTTAARDAVKVPRVAAGPRRSR